MILSYYICQKESTSNYKNQDHKSYFCYHFVLKEILQQNIPSWDVIKGKRISTSKEKHDIAWLEKIESQIV